MTKTERTRDDKLLRFWAALAKKPVIAGLKGIEHAQLAAERGILACFYLTGNIFELRELAKICRAKGQMVFAHVDLINGIAKDGVEPLPAPILPYIARRLPRQLPPIIAGGLVETFEELEMVLRTPVVAVSTSQMELWSYRKE